jgi:hypothetical protein
MHQPSARGREGLERFDRRARTADRENLVEEALTGGGIEGIAGFFKGGIGVGWTALQPICS